MNKEQYFLNTFARKDITLTRGDGMYVYDNKGNKYLDFLAGIAVNSLGYNHPEIVSTIQQQAEKIMHVSNLFWNEPGVELAKELVDATHFDRVFYANSGAEANEGAIKIARKYQESIGYPEKYEMITLRNSFHGRTLATVAATGQDKFHAHFQPLPEGFVSPTQNTLREIEALISDKTGSIMIELIQGEGGVEALSQEFVDGIVALCTKYQLVCIVDEIQTGMGRCGTLFAYEGYSIKPDIITVAKGLGGGVPIGAVLVNEEIAKAMKPGDHGTTFGGNPLVCAVGLCVFSTINTDSFLENINQVANHLREKLILLAKKYPQHITAITGKGLLCGIRMIPDAGDVMNQLLLNGVIVGVAGQNTLRLAPPLIATTNDVDIVISTLESCLQTL